MTKFRIVPDDEDRIVVVPSGDTKIQDPVAMIESYISGAEKIKKLLKDEKKDERPKGKTYTKSDMTCLSFLLLATAPLTGVAVLKLYAWALLQYGVLLPNLIK